MKQITIFWICFMLANIGFGQDPTSIITIELGANGKFIADAGTIPHGQKISLKGKGGATDFKKIDIEVITLSGKQTISATIDKEGWTADIGPFQPRQLITLSIKALTMSKIYITPLNDAFKTAYKATFTIINDEFEKRSAGILPTELKKIFFDNMKSELGTKIDNYFIEDGKKVADFLPMVIDTNCLFQSKNGVCSATLLSTLSNIDNANDEIVLLKNTIAVLNRTQDSLKRERLLLSENIKSFDNLSTKLKNDTIASGISNARIVEIRAEIADLLSKKRTEQRKDSLLKDSNSRVSFLIEEKNAELKSREIQKKQGQKDLDTLQKSMQSKIKFSTITTAIPLSSIDLRASGIEYYGGFDVSAITFDTELGATALYFTVSPYLFGKFDPELDFSDVRKKVPSKEDPTRGKIRWQNVGLFLRYHVSPTVGIAFVGNADSPSSPQIFAGGSLRINRIFKITIGSVFYRNVNYFNKSNGMSTLNQSSPGTKYLYNFSLGMSINISYFGTVMQMLGSATRSVKNAPTP